MKTYIRQMLLMWLADQWEQWNALPDEDKIPFTIYVEAQAVDLMKEVISDFEKMLSNLRLKWLYRGDIEKAVEDVLSSVRRPEK